MRILVLIYALLAGTAQADPVCDELWFTRNLVFDRAGYCFGSELGQSTFDNDGCTTSSPNLSPKDRALINAVRDIEIEWGCSVASTIPRPLDVNTDLRRQIQDLPVVTGYESSCFGWQAAPMAVRVGRSDDAQLLGHVFREDSVGFGHIPVDGWEFVTVVRNEKLVEEGWAYFGPHDETRCEGWAG